MTQKILRGRVLSFNRQPDGADDHGAYTYIEDGGILVSGGKIEAAGEFRDLPTNIEVIDHRPNLLMAGFIVPDRGYVKPTALAGWACGTGHVDWSYGIIQTRQPHSLGL